jgi:hypothetical protein
MVRVVPAVALSIGAEEGVDMSQVPREKLIYLRQWVGDRVSVVTNNQNNYEGQLTNIVFDGTRLMYIMLDDQVCLNFDHVVEIRIRK